MNIWRDIGKERIKKDEFVACIEIAKGSKINPLNNPLTANIVNVFHPLAKA